MLSVVWNLDLLVINRVLVWANHGGQFGQVVLGTSLSVATWSAPLLSFGGRLLDVDFGAILFNSGAASALRWLPPGATWQQQQLQHYST